MAAKKRKAAPARRRSYAARAAPRKRARNTTGVKDIPVAAMTVGIIAANADPIRAAVSNLSIDGIKNAASAAIAPEQLKKTAAYAIGGAMIGYGIKQFAPKFIKKPVGLVAKKIKGVF